MGINWQRREGSITGAQCCVLMTRDDLNSGRPGWHLPNDSRTVGRASILSTTGNPIMLLLAYSCPLKCSSVFSLSPRQEVPFC